MKSRWEIMFAWFAVLTVGGWCADLFTHVPQASAWIHATWRVISLEHAHGVRPGTVWLTIIRSLAAAVYLIPLGAAMTAGIVAWWVGPGPGPSGGITRGSTVTSARDLTRSIKEYEARRDGKHTRTGEDGDITIGGVPVPRDLENKHFLIAGSTGTGKTVALTAMVSVMRERDNDRAVIVDPGASLMSRFWREGDTILNPLDARSARWSPFAEMTEFYDADRLAQSILPDLDPSTEGAAWQGYAQSLTTAVLEKMFADGGATNGELFRRLVVDKIEALAEVAAGGPAAAMFDEGSERMLSNIRTVVGSAFKPFRFLPQDAGADSFSIRRWVEDGTGWLWLPVRADMRSSLRPLLAAWIGELVNATISLRPDRDRRLWLLLDEVAALGRVQSLSDALAEGRKFGLCCVAGLQAISQVRAAYGMQAAQTMLACFRSTLILGVGDHDTGRWAAEHLGEQELTRRVRSEGTDAGGVHSGASEQHAKQMAVMAEEIGGLDDLHGFLKLPGNYPIARVQLELPPERAEICAPFIAAPRAQSAKSLAARGNDGSAPAPEPAPPALSPTVQALVDQMLAPTARK
ncbi:MAG: type IV secretion system DNA-binding domain-containing protein [Acidiferrobacteraceae bacterium]